MARNPFEQLQDVVPEPRQAFEDIVTLILKCLYPDSRRVRVHRGDGGIDAYSGTLGDGGEADVYQAKYFPTIWGDPQKQQIREAYQTARDSNVFRLRKWTLCVPVRLTKEDIRWFDGWKKKQDCPVELLDGDDLTLHVTDERCAPVRQRLKGWGAIGIQEGGPQFKLTAVIREENHGWNEKAAVVLLRLDNVGDQTARGVRATVIHAETGCVPAREPEDWQCSASEGGLNARVLRFRHTLNPGDYSVVMGIPLSKRSSMPFWISIKLTADDCRPTEFNCLLSVDQLNVGEQVACERGPIDVSTRPLLPSTKTDHHPS